MKIQANTKLSPKAVAGKASIKIKTANPAPKKAAKQAAVKTADRTYKLHFPEGAGYGKVG